jgi:hypothetical protein
MVLKIGYEADVLANHTEPGVRQIPAYEVTELDPLAANFGEGSFS